MGAMAGLALPEPRAGDRAPLRAAWATAGVFFASGLLISSWVSRIPSVREALRVDPGRLGLVLLGLSTGAVLALPTAGAVVGRLGPRRTVGLAAPLSCGGIAIVALAATGPIWLLATGLFVCGIGYGIWDVAMNVQGAIVERAIGRSIMPRFHACFSLGTVVGALVGAGVELLGVSARVHLLTVAILLAALTPVMGRAFLPGSVQASRRGDGTGGEGGNAKAASAWREPRTVLIGLLVVTFAFTEGTGNDWLALATVDGFHRSNAFGSLVFGVFVAAMTLGRLTGTRLLDRFGRVAVLRSSCLVAAVGVACIVLGPGLAFVFVGPALWGLGASLGFPVGMSAAADDPARESARVGVVASIAYTAFLAGPPLVGFLGNRVGVRHALAVTALLALAGFALSPHARRVEPGTLETAPLAEGLARGELGS